MGHRVFPPCSLAHRRAGAIRLQYQHTLKGREALRIVFIAFLCCQAAFLAALVRQGKPLQAAREGLSPENPLVCDGSGIGRPGPVAGTRA